MTKTHCQPGQSSNQHRRG